MKLTACNHVVVNIESMLEPVLLCVRKKQKPQFVMLSDAYGVNIPIADLKLQVTEYNV